MSMSPSPADGWAADYKGEKPSLTRSGTLVADLGANQRAWLSNHPIFRDAARRVQEVAAHSKAEAKRLGHG